MRRGVTLVEVSLALLVMGVVMGAGYSFFSFGARTAGRAGARAGGVDAVSGALLQISRRLRYAESVDVPGRGQERDVLEFTARNAGTWELGVVPGEGMVLEEKFGAARKLLARGVSRSSFRRSPGDDQLLKVELWVPRGQKEQRYWTHIYLRGTRRRAGR